RGLVSLLEVRCLVLDRCGYQREEACAHGIGDGGPSTLHPDVVRPPPPPPPPPPRATPARFDRPMIPWVPQPDPKPLDEDALARWEQKHGVQLPPLLRHHLRLDDSAKLWADAVPHAGDALTVFFPTGDRKSVV